MNEPAKDVHVKQFRLGIIMDESEVSYKELRSFLAQAVDQAGGTLYNLNFMGAPDPYLFEDPDKMPKGVQ